jgi:hypothetical protein
MKFSYDITRQQCLRAVSSVAVVLAMAVSLSSTDAAAISRYESTSLSCSTIKAKIQGEGAVILQYVSNQTGNLLYNRYVRNANYCNAYQTTRSKSVPAADTQNCHVYYCVTKERNCSPFGNNC